jgi:hypothetical protein
MRIIFTSIIRQIYKKIHHADQTVSLLNRAVPLLKKDGLDLFFLDAEELILAERISEKILTVITMEKSTNYGKVFSVMKRIRKELSGGEDVRG